MKCQRQYLECDGEAVGEIANRNVCRGCLEYGEDFDIKFGEDEVC